MQRPENKIGAQIQLMKLPMNTSYEFFFDKETDWVKDLLVEMNENASYKRPENLLNETTLVIQGQLQRKNKMEYSEYLLATGTIAAEYATECVRTLRPMKVKLEIPFKVCFIDESLSSTELFADLDETYVDNDVYEIYFYTKRTIQFQEMIHEQIYLNYNQYPVLDADAKLVGVDIPISSKT
jgi:uncharacterized metal-binding protein YceD (DUF177 family)